MFINRALKPTLRAACLFLILPLALKAQDGTEMPPVDTVPGVMMRYLKAHGGELAIERVKALRIEGEVEAEGHVSSFLQIKKVPNLERTKIAREEGDLSMGYNGEVAWVKPARLEGSLRMDPEQAAGYTANTPIISQLYRLRNYPENIRLSGVTEIRGHPAIELQLQTLEAQRMTLFLDARTFYGLKTEILAESDQGTFLTETYFSDFQFVKPFHLPFRIETYVNQELKSVVRIESIHINPGIFDAYFDPPGGITDKATGSVRDERKMDLPAAVIADPELTEEAESILGEDTVQFLPAEHPMLDALQAAP